MSKPFLITIDTEGDNLWSNPKEVTTENARYIPRFQELCEKYGFKPTYLTNYEMASDPFFQEIGRSYLEKQTAEIGGHLHSWDSPPIDARYGSNGGDHSYMTEIPDDLLDQKIEFLTNLLRENFGIAPISFRAGKWTISGRVMRLLLEHGYRVDCSVTPYVNWSHEKGLSSGNGGADYRYFPRTPYFVDLDDISRPGHSEMLELPMTIIRNYNEVVYKQYQPIHTSFAGRVFRKIFGQPVTWLRPDILNLGAMLQLVDQAVVKSFPYIEFMLHSSEFMPGGSPTFKTKESIENLYRDMDTLFKHIADNGFVGKTLSEYRSDYLSGLN